MAYDKGNADAYAYVGTVLVVFVAMPVPIYACVGRMLACGNVCDYAYAYASTKPLAFVAIPVPMPMSAQCLPAAAFVARPMPMPMPMPRK